MPRSDCADAKVDQGLRCPNRFRRHICPWTAYIKKNYNNKTVLEQCNVPSVYNNEDQAVPVLLF